MKYQNNCRNRREDEYQITEVKGKTNYQICRNRTNITPKKKLFWYFIFPSAKCKYQTAKAKGKTKYQICRNITNITPKKIILVFRLSLS